MPRVVVSRPSCRVCAPSVQAMAEQITLTREELYLRVWQTPMSRLATEFAISDVALAKICKKVDVPIPGRGHWARVASGQRVKLPKLPKARAETRTEYTIAEREPRPPAMLRVDVPEVKVSDSLSGGHPAVRRLAAVLEGREPPHPKSLHLRGDSEATVRLSDATKRRALLILDALLKALAVRGHAVELKVPTTPWGYFDLETNVAGEVVKLFIAEPLTRREHQTTAKEEADQRRYGATYAPKYDFDASGRLSLRARARYAINRRWSDGARQRLEDELGAAVLGIEALARAAAVRRAEIEDNSRRQSEEQRRRQTCGASQLRARSQLRSSGRGRQPAERGSHSRTRSGGGARRGA